ncbi:hypothetical protein BSNK01_11900 [Bacillaceae bacterium]
MPFTREDLFAMAEKHGIRQNKSEALRLVREELMQYFQSPEGQEELRRLPRVYVDFNADFPLQDTQLQRVVDLLMPEVEKYAEDLERDARKGQVDPTGTGTG